MGRTCLSVFFPAELYNCSEPALETMPCGTKSGMPLLFGNRRSASKPAVMSFSTHLTLWSNPSWANSRPCRQRCCHSTTKLTTLTSQFTSIQPSLSHRSYLSFDLTCDGRCTPCPPGLSKLVGDAGCSQWLPRPWGLARQRTMGRQEAVLALVQASA